MSRILGRSGPALSSRHQMQLIRLRGFVLLYDSREATATLPPPMVPRSLASSSQVLGVLNPRELASQVAALKSEGPMPDVALLQRAAHVGNTALGAIEHVGLQEQQLGVVLAFWSGLISHHHSGHLRLAMGGAAAVQLLPTQGLGPDGTRRGTGEHVATYVASPK